MIVVLTRLPLMPHTCIGWALVQIMVCRLFGDKPLSKPMLGFCQLDSQEQTSVNFLSEDKIFHSRKCVWMLLSIGKRSVKPVTWLARLYTRRTLPFRFTLQVSFFILLSKIASHGETPVIFWKYIRCMLSIHSQHMAARTKWPLLFRRLF